MAAPIVNEEEYIKKVEEQLEEMDEEAIIRKRRERLERLRAKVGAPTAESSPSSTVSSPSASTTIATAIAATASDAASQPPPEASVQPQPPSHPKQVTPTAAISSITSSSASPSKDHDKAKKGTDSGPSVPLPSALKPVRTSTPVITDMFAEDIEEEIGSGPATPSQEAIFAEIAEKTGDDAHFINEDPMDDGRLANIAKKAAQASANPNLVDNWDDADGYYRLAVGEILDGRFRITTNLGRGVFSSVVKAVNEKSNKEVAVKLIRNNETMYKAGQKEIMILKKLNDQDPQDKRHIVRMLDQFEHRNHLCIVFESMGPNLREIIRRFGKDVGLNLKAVRTYATHLFLGLSHMKKCNIIHADLKPDNILVNNSFNVLKICDLGSASTTEENEITPYLVSRYYRAPEIILGCPYGTPIDVWSAGCTLYELYTGKILFPGKDNNHMLLMFMEVRGKFSNKMIRKGQFSSKYFDDQYNFLETEPATKRLIRKVTFTQPERDLKKLLSGLARNEKQQGLLKHFIDFLDQCLVLNPDKRITPDAALRHPFIRGKD